MVLWLMGAALLAWYGVVWCGVVQQGLECLEDDPRLLIEVLWRDLSRGFLGGEFRRFS